MYLRVKYEPGLWVVGFHRTDGLWRPESEHASWQSAAARVRQLNRLVAESDKDKRGGG